MSRTGSRPICLPSRRRWICCRRSATRPGSARSQCTSRIRSSRPAAARRTWRNSRCYIGGNGCAAPACCSWRAALPSGFFIAALWPGYRFALRRHVVLGLIGLGYLAAAWGLALALPHVADLVRYNTGQYRHALDMTFASAALALVLASAIAAPDPTSSRPARRLGLAGSVWIGLIVLDIGSGALFAARDAATVWRGFPGYETGLLPPLDRLVAYAPLWLNFTFNQYTIQLVHRVLSIGLWVALIGNLIWTGRRSARALGGSAVLLVLVTAQMAAGIAALRLGGPAAASLLHELGAIALLAGAFVLASLRVSPN